MYDVYDIFDHDLGKIVQVYFLVMCLPLLVNFETEFSDCSDTESLHMFCM